MATATPEFHKKENSLVNRYWGYVIGNVLFHVSKLVWYHFSMKYLESQCSSDTDTCHNKAQIKTLKDVTWFNITIDIFFVILVIYSSASNLVMAKHHYYAKYLE